MESAAAVAGPMAHCAEDLELFMRAVVERQSWMHDPKLLPIPWRAVELPQRMCFAMSFGDSTLQPHPPIRRGMVELKAALERAGHSVIEWTLPEADVTERIIGGLFGADGGQDCKARQESRLTASAKRDSQIG
jgi:amidase